MTKISEVTQTDIRLLLESVNRQLALDGQLLRLTLEITATRKVTIYRVVSTENRDISGPGEGSEIYNVLRSLQAVLQIMGL